MSTAAATPEVLWAQRSHPTDAAKNYLYVTITVPDVKSPKIEVTSDSLSFSGHSDSLKRDYSVVLNFFAEIDTAETKQNHTSKNIQFVLRKKELKEEFWPRLLKDAKKVHYLKTDFDKWVDEDEQEEAPEDDMANNMGGMGGMPGMGDMSSMMGGAGGDFGGIDFSKLGGGAGMGGEEEDEDEDDDEMPNLEGAEDEDDDEEEVPAASSSKPAAKITEIK